MESSKEQKELQQFLAKIDDVDSILKGLVSDDPEVQAQAIAKADKKIKTIESKKKKSATEIGFDRSSINKNAYDDDGPPQPNFTEQHTSQDAFLASLEADSKKRAQARKERHRKANVIKEEGNKAFKDENMEEAVRLYTEAMDVAKDLTPLYTNRAAAYLKLEEYEKAIADCDFALRIDETWIKSFIFKAKALQKLHQYDAAALEYKKIVDIDKTKEKMVENYIVNLEKDRKQYILETKANDNLQSHKQEAVNISKLIRAMKRQSNDKDSQCNNLMYFAGGLQVLQEHLVDEQSRTLFRTEGGFRLFSGEGIISKCLRSKLFGGTMTPHCVELVSAVITLCTISCSKIEENLKALFEEPNMPELFVSFLTWPEEQVKRCAILFFHEASLSSATRSVLYTCIDCLKTSIALFKPGTNKAVANTNAAAALCNLSLDKKYFKILQKDFEPYFVGLIKQCLLEVGKSSYEALSLRMRFVASLAEIPEICRIIAQDTFCFQEAVKSLERSCISSKNGSTSSCALEELLQFLKCLVKMHNTEEDCAKILTILKPVVLKAKNDDLLSYALNLVGVVFEVKKNLIDLFFSDGGYCVVTRLLGCMQKDLRLRTYALKILCSAGQLDSKYVQPLLKLDKNYNILRNVLTIEDETEEINQGHVALLLGALSLLPKGLEPILDVNAEGDVVRRLLVLCRKSKHKQVCANSAIALGKLSFCHPNFLTELRFHDGINILSRLKAEDVLD